VIVWFDFKKKTGNALNLNALNLALNVLYQSRARKRKEAFRVSTNRAQSKAERKRKLINRKRSIQWRLRDRSSADQPRPMFAAGSIQYDIHYELADRVRGLGPGGIGAMHLLATRTGLVEAIDRRRRLLKVHLPYHESDHVLNIAYNLLSGGTCLAVRRDVSGRPRAVA
jgi:hypothetical protein